MTAVKETAEVEPSFGSTLRELRLAAALTLEGLAEASGVSVRGIGDLERGRRSAPQRRTVAALAEGLRLPEPERRRLMSAARAGRSDGYTPVGVQAVPHGIPDFVGRERELARFTTLAGHVGPLSPEGGAKPGRGGRPVIVAVSGPPGAGKTTLALQAARRLADHCPDGQIVVDMRGLDATAPQPAELMLGVLRALRVADRELAKAGPEGHLGLYRQVLAERRVVLVLDNARDEAQVRPLLPGAGSGIVVVTSRRMLTGLEGVHRLPLDGLEASEATELLTALAGGDRAAADTRALERIARYCGNLPLALRLAGSWLAAHPTWPADRLADRLAPDESRLAALSAGDVHVSAAFDLSYRRLSTASARLFRRLALVPGSDLSAAGAARLSGQDLFDAEDTLEELVEAGLLGVERDRYRLHDLLRLYARDQLHAEEEPQEAAGARKALHTWLLDTAVVAGRWFEPGYGAPPADWNGCVDLSTADKGRAWLQDEGENWLAALRAAAESGDHATVVQVAESLHWFSDQWIFWRHWSEVFGLAADSARALDDPVLWATHLNYLAWARLLCEGRYLDSLTCSARALAVAQVAGDTRQQAWADFYQAGALRRLGTYDAATEHLTRARRLFEAAKDVHGGLSARHGLALTLSDAGRRREALDACREALAYLDEAGDRIGTHSADLARAGIHAAMADCSEGTGDMDDAVSCLSRAIDLSGRSGNTGLQSRYLARLGKMLLGMGRVTETRDVYVRIVALGPHADPDVARHAAARLDEGEGRP
ncbi:helix-turn-helix domain-containing protein [Streptomyces sp. NPDC021139]|uniref:ATP-binding protein n=1 Tax=unclassified Streptomyces TaxID=2593676 RepID=UPI00340FCDEC